MAVVSPSSPETLGANIDKSDAETQNPASSAPQESTHSSAPGDNLGSDLPNPNPNPSLQPSPVPVAPLPPAVPSFTPSFRPLGVPPPPAPLLQYSAVPNPVQQNAGFQMAQAPGVQPSGIAAPVPIMPPGAVSGVRAVAVPVAGMPPGSVYQVAPGQPPSAVPMAYGQVPNGYMPPPQAPMGMPPPGVARYPGPYPMIRPGFPPRPVMPTGMIPQLPRPPIPGIRGVPPVVTPIIRPVAPNVASTEKPQTTVYVGKIASTVDCEFLRSLLELCGPVNEWKRARDPSDNTPKGFGFCEFKSAEGVLRSLRLLNKLNIDGQELVLNINQATREYLENYVEKKREENKLKETKYGSTEKESENTAGDEKLEPRNPVAEKAKKDSDDSEDKENQENSQKFGLVTDEDHEADRDALDKLTNMLEERLKNKPLAPPAHISVDASAKSNSEALSKSRDIDSDIDILKSDAAEDKNDEETTSESKTATENDKTQNSSPDKARRHDRRSRERDREHDLKREKERALERVERERERERVRREREREYKIREAERLYKESLKDWEVKEREKENQRQREKDREKERERERRKEIMRQEEESDDDDYRKRRRRSDTLEERRRKRKREKEEDFGDRLKEEEEIAEAKRRAVEEQPLKDDPNSPKQVAFEGEKASVLADQAYSTVAANGDNINGLNENNSADDLTLASVASSDMKQNSAPARKLGFGLIGSGKRTTVPSVFHEEDDEDVDEKKMRPLVPIDYSAEELQAVQNNASGAQPNLVAAAEFAKHISGVNPKEEKFDVDKERNRRSTDRSNLRERDRNDETTRSKDENREKIYDKSSEREKDRVDKPKTENKKLLDAKQLIDMIPKTKEELFVYEINWDIYDKHQLHERMRPWISKKITEFLGEEEKSLVDYIVNCTTEHVQASKMLELLQAILDDEAEMFVLKMWRMLIFEIKKIETGLSVKL